MHATPLRQHSALSSLLAASLLAVTLAACSSTPSAGDEQPEVFCSRETMTGTNIPKSKCRTREQIKADQEQVDRVRDEISRTPMQQQGK